MKLVSKVADPGDPGPNPLPQKLYLYLGEEAHESIKKLSLFVRYSVSGFHLHASLTAEMRSQRRNLEIF